MHYIPAGIVAICTLAITASASAQPQELLKESDGMLKKSSLTPAPSCRPAIDHDDRDCERNRKNPAASGVQGREVDHLW